MRAFLTGFFILLCLLHFFSFRSLWLDELSILENLKTLKAAELFGPLAHCQVFPRMYLFCISWLSSLFDFGPLSLRALPLLFMLLAVFVWEAVYRRAFHDRTSSLLALFSFTAAFQLVYYAAELKPYSMDVFAVGVFCVFLYFQNRRGAQKPSLPFVLLALALPAFLAFSYAAFLIFWVPFYNFVLYSRRNSLLWPLTFSYAVVSLAFCVFVFLFDIRYGLRQECLYAYWNDYFLHTSSPYLFLKSFGEGLRNLVAWPFGDSKIFLRSASLFIPFFLIGIFSSARTLLREARKGISGAEAVSFIIFIELFFLGALRKYPFTGERITLFFMPLVFLLIARGIGALRKQAFLHKGLVFSYSAFLAFCGANTVMKIIKLYRVL